MPGPVPIQPLCCAGRLSSPKAAPRVLACRGLEPGFPVPPASAPQAPGSPVYPILVLTAALPSTPPPPHCLPSFRDQICQLWEELATGCPALLVSWGGRDGPVLCLRNLQTTGKEWPPPHPPTGMARGLGQDVGKASVSPVDTRGFPDPCPAIVGLGMTHLWGPFPTLPSSPRLPHPVSTCPALPPPTPRGLHPGRCVWGPGWV